MGNPAKKTLRRGVERLVAKGLGSLSAEEIDLANLLKRIARTARTATGDGHRDAEPPQEIDRSFGDVVLNLARSVESLSDLEARLRANRGEFAKIARSLSRQLIDLLDGLSDPPTAHPRDTVQGEIVDAETSEHERRRSPPLEDG